MKVSEGNRPAMLTASSEALPQGPGQRNYLIITDIASEMEWPLASSLGFGSEIIYKLAVYSTFRVSQGKP